MNNMENKILVSKEVLDFLTGVHGDRNDKEQRKAAIFNRAFELAYRDMATHTVVYTQFALDNYVQNSNKRCNENRKAIKQAIRDFVQDEIFGKDLSALKKEIQANQFDKWHKSACNTFVEINCKIEGLNGLENTVLISKLLCNKADKSKNVFTYGQAQKLINMMVKYLYIFYRCEGFDELDMIKDFAHAPIDSYVLKAAGIEANGDIAWSKIDNYKTYKEYRDDIKQKAVKKGYKNDFQWELAEWPFGYNEQ